MKKGGYDLEGADKEKITRKGIRRNSSEEEEEEEIIEDDRNKSSITREENDLTGASNVEVKEDVEEMSANVEEKDIIYQALVYKKEKLINKETTTRQMFLKKK